MMPLGFESKMQVSDAASSSSISPPPDSPPNHSLPSDTIHVKTNFGGGVLNSNAAAVNSGLPSNATNGNASTSTTTNTNSAAPEKPKRPRKKKEVVLGPDGKPVPDDKPKKPRKPREPKEKATGANGTTTTAPRRKPKTAEQKAADEKIAQDALAPAAAQARQPTITELVGGFQQPTQPASTTIPSQPQHRNSDGVIRNNMPPTSNPATPRPISSGQNYDPIRGSTMEARPSILHVGADRQAQASPQVNRASASPSIASLIDPPAATKPQTMPYSPQATIQQPFVPSQQSPPPSKLSSAPFAPPPPPESPGMGKAAVDSTMDGAMDIEPTCEIAKPQIPEIKAPSKSSSSAPTPKIRPTPEPPKGTGSGLLSSSDLFGGPSSSEPSERKGVNIDLHIPLNPKGGNTINIAQEIIKKYGRDAINPRAAAHREQLLRIAAEQERLGGLSNDEMSVDLLSEMEGDSNVEMGGMDDEKSNTGLDADGKPPRKRRKKVEEYDKEDDFIDDTELAWQEQAAVAKDGFFVYSGPLVPEGQQPQVESTTTTKGSRGRGRGRGGKTATSGTTHASLAEKKEPTPTTTSTASTSTRSRGTRGRGTGAPRKPRITKADRERMESEKVDRERTAASMNNTGPNGTPVKPTAAPAPAPPTPTPTTAPAPHLPSMPAQPQPQPQQQLSAQSYNPQAIVIE